MDLKVCPLSNALPPRYLIERKAPLRRGLGCKVKSSQKLSLLEKMKIGVRPYTWECTANVHSLIADKRFMFLFYIENS